MGLRLVRETSQTPNITNKDDVKMVRYAYGGENGVVKSFGSECDYTATAGVFKILDGRIVIDGWEIDVDGAGWQLNVSNVTGTQHHSVFLEVNVATESVKIESSYFTDSYPEISKGDDLTEIPNGTARIPLYAFRVQNGSITSVTKLVKVLEYTSTNLAVLKTNLNEQISTINLRLAALGFKTGVAYVFAPDFVVPDEDYRNSLKKQGKYCLFDFRWQSNNGGPSQIMIPEDFRPDEDTEIVVCGRQLTVAGPLSFHGFYIVESLSGDIVDSNHNVASFVYPYLDIIIKGGWEVH